MRCGPKVNVLFVATAICDSLVRAFGQLEILRNKALAGGGEQRVHAQHTKGKLTARERLEVKVQSHPRMPATNTACFLCIVLPFKLFQLSICS